MSDRVGFDDAAAEMTGMDAGMAKRCYYDVLGVERTAGDGELKSAFRKLAMKWHPDRNPSDKSCEVRFKEINEAYEILKDADASAAPICATTWKSAWRRPISARPPRCASPPR